MHPYAVTIFLSAFLLFLVQPLIARQILPWFGGAASVWTTCLVFFQCVLLAGYGYAHAVVRWLKPRQQVYLHTALLLGSPKRWPKRKSTSTPWPFPIRSIIPWCAW